MSKGGDCDFVLAIVKGLVEHDDGATYFASLMGYQRYEAEGIRLGWLVRGPKMCRDGDTEFVIESTRLTDAGRVVYADRHLDRLPNGKGLRAYFWDWSVID